MTDACDYACKPCLLAEEMQFAAREIDKHDEEVFIFELDHWQYIHYVWFWALQINVKITTRIVGWSTFWDSIVSLHSHWTCCIVACHEEEIFKKTITLILSIVNSNDSDLLTEILCNGAHFHHFVLLWWVLETTLTIGATSPLIICIKNTIFSSIPSSHCLILDSPHTCLEKRPTILDTFLLDSAMMLPYSYWLIMKSYM